MWFGWLECPPVNRKDISVGSQSGHTPRFLVPSPAWTPRRWREHHGPAASCAPSAGDGARNPRVFPKRNQTWFADGGSTTEQRGLGKIQTLFLSTWSPAPSPSHQLGGKRGRPPEAELGRSNPEGPWPRKHVRIPPFAISGHLAGTHPTLQPRAPLQRGPPFGTFTGAALRKPGTQSRPDARGWRRKRRRRRRVT